MTEDPLKTNSVDLTKIKPSNAGTYGLSPPEISVTIQDDNGNPFLEVNASKREFKFYNTFGNELHLTQDELYNTLTKMSRRFLCKGCSNQFPSYWEFESHLLDVKRNPAPYHINMDHYDDTHQPKYKVIK